MNARILYSFLCFLLIFSSSKAQKFEWAKKISGDLSEYINDAVIDANDYIYVTGHFRDSVDFDMNSGVEKLGATGFSNAYIGKYSSDGSLLWVKHFGGVDHCQSFAIQQDNAGNLIIGGLYSSTVDFDPGVGNTSRTSNGLEDIFLAKFDSSGNFIWVKGLGGTSYEQINTIDIDVDNNIYVGGFVRGTLDLDPGAGISNYTAVGQKDIYVSKFTPAGNFSWGFGIGSSSGEEEVVEILVDNSNKVYITGYFRNTVDFDPGSSTNSLTSSGSEDNYVAQYDSAGNYQWAFKIGGGSSERGTQVASDGLGNIFVSGQYGGTVDFDPSASTANITSYSVRDVFVSKYTSAGSYVWAFGIGGSTSIEDINDLTFSGGDLYITGHFRDSIDFDPGPNTFDLITDSNDDMFLASYSDNGEFNFASSLSSGPSDRSDHILVNGLNEIYTIGSFYNTVDFDPWTTISSLTAQGSVDVFISKYVPCLNGSPTANASSIAICPGDSVSIFNSGSLNDHDHWSWYNAGCGSGEIGDGDTLTFTLSSSSSFYVRAEGRCLAPSSCDSIFIFANDTIDPIPAFASLPDSISECSMQLSPPMATDNCVGQISGTTSDSTMFTTQGMRTITWTFDDGNGNVITQTQNVIIDDTTAPVPTLTSLPDSIGMCGISVQSPTANDNCAGLITGTTSDSTSFTTQGIRLITWTFDDGHGNIETQIQNVIVLDTVAPIPLLSNLADSFGMCEVTVNPPMANDSCIGQIIGTTDDSTYYNTQGNRQIIWYFDDGHGNVSSQTQNVIVLDTVPPSITCADNVLDSINDGSSSKVVNGISATATDSCSGVTITYEITGVTTSSGNNDASGESFNLGISTLRYYATDAYGNVDSCDIEIEMIDPYVGLIENIGYKVSIFPNPTEDVVQFKGVKAATTLKVMNSLGEMVLERQISENEIVDFSNLDNGMYFLQLNSDSQISITKLILKK